MREWVNAIAACRRQSALFVVFVAGELGCEGEEEDKRMCCWEERQCVCVCVYVCVRIYMYVCVCLYCVCVCACD